MNQIKVLEIAAFTSNGQGGNSAGLVWPAVGLKTSERQRIATQAGYSETAFVERTPKGNLRLEYFTPNRQISLCGHATVAAFSYLRNSGEVSLGRQRFESVAGEHEVEVTEKAVGLWQEQLDSEDLQDPQISEKVRQSLNLRSSEIIIPLKVASNGSPFLLIEINSLSSLRNINPNQEEILRLSEQLKLVGYYVYFRAGEKEIDARMFAPAYGIPEESATGMAAGALAICLSKRDGAREFLISQGHLMPNPSPALLYADVSEGGRVLISGESTHFEGCCDLWKL